MSRSAALRNASGVCSLAILAVGLAGLTGFDIDGGGQVGEKPANDAHVFGADRAGGLRGGHVGQHRLQRFVGHRGARPQGVGFLQAPAGLAATDARTARRSRTCCPARGGWRGR